MEKEYKNLRCYLADLGVSPLGALIVARCAEHLAAEPTEVKKTFAGVGMRTLPRSPTEALPWVLIHVVANRFMGSHVGCQVNFIFCPKIQQLSSSHPLHAHKCLDTSALF